MDRLKAKLRGASIKKTATVAVNGGAAQTVAIISLPVEITATEALLSAKPWSDLFPFAVETMRLIAGKEGDDKRGISMKAKGATDELHLEIYSGELEDKPTFEWSMCVVKSKPELIVLENGEGYVAFKVQAQVSKANLGELAGYVDADVLLTMLPAQRTIDEAIAENTAKAKRGRPRKVDLEVADDDPENFAGVVDSVSYRFSDDAAAYLKSSLELHDDLKEYQVVESARRTAQLESPKKKKIVVQLQHVQDVIGVMVKPSLSDDEVASVMNA